MKKTITYIVAAIVIILVIGVVVNLVTRPLYNNDDAETDSYLIDLDETNWIQTDDPDEDGNYNVAYISEGRIEVFIVNDENETVYLYWSGSYEEPEIVDGRYTWESVAISSRNRNSNAASGDQTKDFYYDDGEIYFTYVSSVKGDYCRMKTSDIDYKELYKDTVNDSNVLY